MLRSILHIVLKLLSPLLWWRIIRNNRDLLYQLVRRNVESNFRGTAGGFLWSFAQPLMMLSVYTFVFSVIFHSRWGVETDTKGGFAIVMLCGLSIFRVFSECIGAACSEVAGHPNYVKKIIFPLEVLPIARVLSCTLLALPWFILLFLGVVFILKTPSWTMLLLPLPLIPLVFLSIGFSFLVASLAVYFRDMKYITAVILQMLFFLSPIFYPAAAVPERFRWIIRLNPLALTIEETRNVFLFGRLPNWNTLLLATAAGLVIAQLGLAWFIKTKKGFADVI